MRTLFEIIEAAKGNEPLELEEARYALAAMDALTAMDHMAMRKMAYEPASPALNKTRGDEMHGRWHRALKKDPKTYLGADNDPASAEYQRRRRISIKLASRFFDDDGAKGNC